jgi:hypothetical protein
MSSTPATSINVINLPIKKTVLNSTMVASIPVIKDNFVNINLNALIGATSSISIIREFNNVLSFSGKVNTNFKLGNDNLPFNRSQTVNILFSVSPGETITVEDFSYSTNTPINFRNLVLIFLIVYFMINVHFDEK